MEPNKNSGTQTVSAVFFDAVARHILAQQAPPDLRGATILLPNYHVAQPLAQALGAASKSVVLLPKMVTLSDWAQGVVLDTPVISDSQRSALLYQQLRKQKWFEQADLWSMTQELLTLFDELTHSLTVLPNDAEVFAAAVQQAYQARQNSTLQLEARLVFELWYAMQAGNELAMSLMPRVLTSYVWRNWRRRRNNLYSCCALPAGVPWSNVSWMSMPNVLR